MSERSERQSDENLYRFVKDDDKRAYTELYNRYKRPLLAYALTKLDASQAEDVVHDLFVKLWDDRHKITVYGQFSFYVFRALRNRIIGEMARSQHVRRYMDSLSAFSAMYALDNADHHVREKLFLENVEQVLHKFGPRAVSIIRLRMQGYNNHEIAEKLGLSEKTIRNQQSLIMKLLRDKFPYLLIFFIS